MFKIKSKKYLPIILFLLFISGCQNTGAMVNVISFQPSDYNVMFLTNNASQSVEDTYMDAVLEFKAKYPREFNNAQEIEKNIEELDLMLDTDHPALIITKDGQLVTQISGQKTKKEIVLLLEKTIHK
ncbi:hypothetical protein QGM71_04905 [Virgibacillus sp. C22-A2]|uniref:Small peptidoglycan-associated lipoprotein n=1 Tax=Virgibacillus tibetensis TaxID=3042313 RepID=A0ABU6KEE2_9BACI|nr:hypothetical protein [Virgibacillus sp. C22-A2]